MIGGVLGRLSRRLDVALLYHTRVGVKWYNQRIDSTRFDRFVVGDIGNVPAERLLFFIDGLRDEYTLLGTPASCSPHAKFFTCMRDGGDLAGTEYVERLSRGRMDFRRPFPCGSGFLSAARETFRRRTEEVRQGRYRPVKVCRVGGAYFMADGKHTASLCAVLGIPPRCLDVTPVLFDSYLWWIREIMERYPARYGKHLRLFEEAMLDADRASKSREAP